MVQSTGLCVGVLSIMDYRSDQAAGVDEFATPELLTDTISIRKAADPI